MTYPASPPLAKAILEPLVSMSIRTCRPQKYRPIFDIVLDANIHFSAHPLARFVPFAEHLELINVSVFLASIPRLHLVKYSDTISVSISGRYSEK